METKTKTKWLLIHTIEDRAEPNLMTLHDERFHSTYSRPKEKWRYLLQILAGQCRACGALRDNDDDNIHSSLRFIHSLE
jgi:hypothetical protein